MKKLKGFTLIELLIVIAIVAILSAVVLIAVNPARQMRDARNVERMAECNAILSAISQYQVDNEALPTCVTTDSTCIGTDDVTPCCDLTTDLVDGGYIAEIPIGPGATCDAANTCYEVMKTATDRITVSAPGAENTTISYTR